jgi:hypothetical protein
MKRGFHVYLSLCGGALLLALAGCGRSFMQGERAAWRHDAEVSCLKSGQVKIGVGVEQMQPIEGPGVCGADFPFKVALLGESSALGYADDPRPPASIPNASPAQPNWPPVEQHYLPPAPAQRVQSAPIQNGNMRWVPGPPGIERSRTSVPRYEPDDHYEPLPNDEHYQPPQHAPPPDDHYPSQSYTPPLEDRSAPMTRALLVPPGQPTSIQPDDIPDDAVLLPGRTQPSNRQHSYNAPIYEQPQQRTPPALGPVRPNMSAASVTVTPPATLACPLVSALDRWVTEGVQPAALRWFGLPVSEIKQISSYSCREMVGSGTSTISEHAFGNALDIAAFTLADGRKITVQDGWNGTPEERGFLHDVQLSACENFTTVLAPGYNIYHYNHIHVDLMRRASGRHPCRPDAIPGEVAAARAREMYVNRRGPAYTGSIPTKATGPVAVPGEDGLGDDDDVVTGFIAKARRASGAVDHDYDLTGGSQVQASTLPRSAHKPTASAEDRVTIH